MKQTVEKAAMQELMSSYAIVVEGELVYQRQAMLNMFKKGAEWQSKQSPWISVEERLPGVGDIVLTKGTYGFLICHLSPFGEWKTESHVNKKKLGITHFMYIPLL